MAVTHYNDDRGSALALALATDESALDGDSEPTTTEATFYWDRAATEVQAAFIRAELDPTKANLSGSALEMAKTAETLFASAWTTLGKSDLQEGLEKSANRLLGQAKVYVGKANVNVPGGWEPGTIQAMRDHWVSRGEADALNLAESSAARSWHVDDRNPDVSLVPGGDDIAYADSYVIFDGDGEAV